MYYCRKNNSKLIHKILFDMFTICVNNKLNTYRKSLTCVTNYFFGDFGPLLLQFHLQSFQNLMVSDRDLAFKVWLDPKIKGIQIRRRWRIFLIGNEVRGILGKPLLSLFSLIWWCGVLLKRPGTFFEVPRSSLRRHIVSLSPLIPFIPIPRQNPIVLGVKMVFNIKFLLINENEIW